MPLRKCFAGEVEALRVGTDAPWSMRNATETLLEATIFDASTTDLAESAIDSHSIPRDH
jgi:hypothetical protein